MANCLFVVTLPKELDSDLDSSRLLQDNAAAASGGRKVSIVNDDSRGGANSTGTVEPPLSVIGGLNVPNGDSTVISVGSKSNIAGSTSNVAGSRFNISSSKSNIAGSTSNVAGSRFNISSSKSNIAESSQGVAKKPNPETLPAGKNVGFKISKDAIFRSGGDDDGGYGGVEDSSGAGGEAHRLVVSSSSGAISLEEGQSNKSTPEVTDGTPGDSKFQAACRLSSDRMKQLSQRFNRKLTPAENLHVELECHNLAYTLTLMAPQSKNSLQLVWLCPASTAEPLLERLLNLGIGNGLEDTSVNLFNPTVSQTSRRKDDNGDRRDTDRMKALMDTMRARLMVSQVYRSVMEKGQWTFDFVCFLACATIIAAVGLATNSSVMTVASMLLSPFMGPILALTFSWRLRRKQAALQCLFNMLLSMLIIFGIGFLLLFLLIGPLLFLGVTDFPTKEMTDRGQHASLLFGIIVASASAYGVSVSVLQGDHSANVGVAISASLLPPVVNSGMLFAYWLLAVFRPPLLLLPTPAGEPPTNATGILMPPNCTYQQFNQFVFKPVYVCSATNELLIMSSLSLALCLVNILLIVVCSYFWLALKEVAPEKTERNEAEREFFERNMRIAREDQECLHGDTRTRVLLDLVRERRKSDDGRARLNREVIASELWEHPNYLTICANNRFPPLEPQRLVRTLSLRRGGGDGIVGEIASGSGSSAHQEVATGRPQPVKRFGRFKVRSECDF